MIALYLNIVNKVSKIQGKLFFHYSKKDRTSCDLFVWRLKQRFPWQGKCHGVTKGWLRGTSSSNLWLCICCRQLPLPHCIATTKQFTGLFCLRQITAAFRYCDTVSRVRELCRGAGRNKKTAHRAIFSVWRLKQRFPWQGKCHGVTKGWLRGTSSSNLWLWICCRQLPLPHCIATTKQFTGLFCLRQITAAFRYCDTVSQVRELCRGAGRNKKDRTSCDLFCLAPQTGFEPVTPRLTAACSANWAIEAYLVLLLFDQVLEPVTGLKHSRLARLERFAILLVSSYSTDQLLVHRTVDPSRQLTAACSANWAIEAYSVCRSELKKYKHFMFNCMCQAYSDNKYYPAVRWILSFVLFFWAINKKCRRRLIFPGGCPPSIFSAEELNYRVRDGNGWTLFAIDTDSIWNTVFSVFLPFWWPVADSNRCCRRERPES